MRNTFLSATKKNAISKSDEELDHLLCFLLYLPASATDYVRFFSFSLKSTIKKNIILRENSVFEEVRASATQSVSR